MASLSLRTEPGAEVPLVYAISDALVVQDATARIASSGSKSPGCWAVQDQRSVAFRAASRMSSPWIRP